MSISPEHQAMVIRVGLAKIEAQESLYRKELKLSRRNKIAGRLAVVATVVGTGVALTTIQADKDNLGWRVVTDLGGAIVAIVEGAIGYEQSTARRKAAGKIASKTLPIAVQLGIDAPSWVHEGRRDYDALLQKTA